MHLFHSIIRVAATSLLLLAAGCAPAYHNYPCGCVPYSYCPPPPLPYRPYDACWTPIAECYLSQEHAPSSTGPQAMDVPVDTGN